MKIRGKIFRKRSYRDYTCENINCISFLEIDNFLQVSGEKIKIIPILSQDSTMLQMVGKSVEIEGEIELRKIITSLGIPILFPIPVIRLKTIERISRSNLL